MIHPIFIKYLDRIFKNDSYLNKKIKEVCEETNDKNIRDK